MFSHLSKKRWMIGLSIKSILNMEQTKPQTEKLTKSTPTDYKRLLLDKEIELRRLADQYKNLEVQIYIKNGEIKQLKELIEASKVDK